MKKLFILLFAIVLFSCEKEVCKDCVTINISYDKFGVIISMTESNKLTCGEELSQISDIPETIEIGNILYVKTIICK